MFKKIFGAFISITILMSILSGCSQPNDHSSSISDEQNSTSSQKVSSNTSNANPNSTSEYSYEPIKMEINADSYHFCNNLPLGVVEYKGKYGLVNTDGKVVVEPIYSSIYEPSEGHCIVEKADKTYAVIDFQGNETGKINYTDPEDGRPVSFDRVEPFSDGLALVNLSNSVGDVNSICVDTNGNVVFESALSIITPFVDGITIGGYSNSSSNTKQIVAIDKTGKEIWRKDRFKDNSLYTLAMEDNIIVYLSPENKLFGAVNINGEEILKCEYEKLGKAGNGRIPFEKYGLWGYLDYSGKVVVEPQYKMAYQFKNGQAIVKTDQNYSVIDLQGNEKFQLDSVESNTTPASFDNGLFLVNSRVEEKSKLVDSNNNTIYEVSIAGNTVYSSQDVKYTGSEIFYVYTIGSGKENRDFYKLIKNN